MHQRSLSELQGVSTQRGASTRRTNQDPGSSKQRRGSGCRCLCPPRGAPLWAWLLLGALVTPGAWSFLDEEQEELLVELHNYYRGQVSPSASAMMPLRWDPNLKVIAEGYAAKCVWNHNPELEETGENLFAGTGALDLRVALEKWFMEHLDYDFHNNSCDEDKMCGHYTQMVWADTHRVGCALHLCNDMEGLDWERVSFLVCNYYPAGNYEDERPYVEGDWCSRCPENLQKCENNLCVDDTVDDDMVVTETEGWTLIPPPATSDPPEVEDEKVVPPPATTDPYVQPATTTTASTPSITTTASWDSEEDTQPPATPAPGTYPPEVPSTTVGEEEKVEEKMEEKIEEKMEEKVEEKMEEKKVEKEEEKRKATTKKEGKDEFIRNEIYQKKEVIQSAGSVSSPSLLLACLTGMLTLRL